MTQFQHKKGSWSAFFIIIGVLALAIICLVGSVATNFNVPVLIYFGILFLWAEIALVFLARNTKKRYGRDHFRPWKN